MSVLTLEGEVENGRIRLLDAPVLKERQKVYVVVPDAPLDRPRLASPRLSDPTQASLFTLEISDAA